MEDRTMMKEDKTIRHFCRMVLKNEKINDYQKQNRMAERECYLEMLGENEPESFTQIFES